MRLCMFIATSAVLLLSTVSPVEATPPTQIAVQGRLTDAAGVPLPAGAKNFVFRIYDDSTFGTRIWPNAPAGEILSITTDSVGLWNTLIGGFHQISNAVFADAVRWLEIEVNGTKLPRTRLVTGPYAFRVASIDGAAGGTITSNVSIGTGHTNTGAFSFVVGESNTVSADNCSVTGGAGNIASGNYAHVGGGSQNTANEAFTAIDGGRGNEAAATGATVGGGQFNSVTGVHATVAGGTGNIASGESSFAAGQSNTASGIYSFVAGESNTASADNCSVVGGSGNMASGNYAHVGGGTQNTASEAFTVIGGGRGNTATAPGSTVGGGQFNSASGTHATVAGGTGNTASGEGSLAAGQLANAIHDGTFVWNDSHNAETFSSTAIGQFLIRAGGGVGIGTAAPESPLHIFKGSAGATTAYASAIAAFESSTNGYLNILTPSSSESGILFGNPSSVVDGGLIYNSAATPGGLQFRTDGNLPRMTLSSAGDLTVTGCVDGNNTACASDRRFKKDIESLEGALSTVEKLQGVSYSWRCDEFPDHNFETGRQTGVIAQEVQSVLPGSVRERADGYLAV